MENVIVILAVIVCIAAIFLNLNKRNKPFD